MMIWHYSYFFLFNADLHEGAVTSVQFHPTDNSKVLTNGMDSCLKIVDLRTGGTPLHTIRHADFQTSYHWSSSCFSPDGTFRSCLFLSETQSGNALAHARMNLIHNYSFFVPSLSYRCVCHVWIQLKWVCFRLG